jgi:hypothetical protein
MISSGNNAEAHRPDGRVRGPEHQVPEDSTSSIHEKVATAAGKPLVVIVNTAT